VDASGDIRVMGFSNATWGAPLLSYSGDRDAFVAKIKNPPTAVDDVCTVAEGGTYNQSASGVLSNDTDPDGDSLTAVKVTDPAHGTVTLNANGSFTYAHDGSETTSDSFTYVANDGLLDSNVATVTITVTPVNDPPVLEPIGDRSVYEAQLLQFAVHATDPDGDALTYFASTLPAGATFDSASGVFSWTPSYEQAGTYEMMFLVVDDGTPIYIDAEEITITVNNVDRAPTDVALSNASVDENQPGGTLVGTLSVTDPDAGDTFGYSLVAGEGDADNAAFAIAGDQLETAASFDYEARNSYTVRVRTTDAGGLTYDETFTIVVTDTPLPTAVTGGIEDLTITGATLTGTVNPNGWPTVARFEWGTDPELAAPTLTDPVDIGGGTDGVPVSALLDGLSQGVTYYYRAVAESVEGVSRGAIDYFSPEPADTAAIVVNSPDDPATPAPGKMTLREAVARLDDGGTITFDPRLDGGRIDLTIVGEEHSLLKGEVFTLDMASRTWLFEGYQERDYGKSALYAAKTLTIDASALPGGITVAWAGGETSHARVLAVYGNLFMSNVTVTSGWVASEALPGNTAQPYTLARGGGLAVWGVARLTDCVISGNRAEGDPNGSRDRGTFGGGIYADTVDLSGCVVSGNAVTGFGGAGGGVYSVGGVESYLTSTVGRSAVTGNRVTAQHAYGGGLYSDGGGPGNLNVLEIKDCTIARNLVEDHPGIAQSSMMQYYYRGGGVYMSNGYLWIEGSTIVENAVTGVATSFGDKPNMGGGGIAATIGDAHVVESMEISRSIIAGNTLGGVPSDVFTGSLLNFYSLGHNLLGKIDFTYMLVPVSAWDCLSRRHYPKTGDRDGVALGDVLDLDGISRHDDIVSVGADSGEQAVLSYPPIGDALDRVPKEGYPVSVVYAGYYLDEYSNPEAVDDFAYLVLDKLRTQYAEELGPDFGSSFGDLSDVIFHGPAYIWPSDPANLPWINFWRQLDAEIGDRLGAVRLGDDFWATFPNGKITEGEYGHDLEMTSYSSYYGLIIAGDTDQVGNSRWVDDWADVGAVEHRAILLSPSHIDENQPAGRFVGTFSTNGDASSGTYTYTLVGGTGDGDNALFQVVGNMLQAQASFDHEAKETCFIRVRSTGPGDAAVEMPMVVRVGDLNEAPTDILLAGGSVEEGWPEWTDAGTFSTIDPDSGDTFTYALVSGDGDADNASFEIVDQWLMALETFDFETKNSYSIRVRAEDAGGLAVEKILTVAVTDVNEAPVAADDDYTVAEGGTLAEAAPGVLGNDFDPEGNLLAALVAGPEHGTLTLNADGSFTYVHDGSETTLDSFTYLASDGSLDSEVATVTITVTPENDPPVLEPVGDQGIAEGGVLEFTLAAVDPDAGQALTFGATGKTSWMTLDASTGAFRATPGLADAGAYPVTFTVTDGTLTDSEAVLITVGQTDVPGDFDLDGMVDLVVFYPANGNWYIKGSSGASVTRNWGWNDTIPVPADYDQDEINDLAVYHPPSGNWHVNGSDGTNLTRNWGWAATIPVPADWDADGQTDLAVYYPTNGTWYIKGSAGANQTRNWGWAATTPVPGDYDGDGILDLAVYYQANGNWYIKGSTAGNITRSWGWNAAMPVPADWDGDGTTDLAVYYPVNGTWYIKGSLGVNRTQNWGWNAAWPVPADWDGDGAVDLAVYYAANGTWYIKGSAGVNRTQNWGWNGAHPVFLQYQINRQTGFVE
jgi:VCBS repeat-containing protein